MALPELIYDFHDAGLTSVRMGPRREITMVVGLDDPARPAHHLVYIRFGGITNFEDVTAFFERVPPLKAPHAYAARIDKLNYDPEEESRQNQLVFLFELDAVGRVQIRCRNIAVGPISDLSIPSDTSA